MHFRHYERYFYLLILLTYYVIQCALCAVCVVIPEVVSTSSDVAPPVDVQFNCNAVDCSSDDSGDHQQQLVLDCPSDSLPAPSRDQPAGHGAASQCCAPSLVCQCLPCDDEQTGLHACGPLQVRVIVSEATGAPGQCCNVHECVDRCEYIELQQRIRTVVV